MINEAIQYQFAFPKIKSQLDNNYNNVIHFNTDTEALNYFQVTDSDFFGGNGNFAYNFAWLDSTHAKDILVDINEIVTNGLINAAQVLNYNYLIVKEILTGGVTVHYYYFFITNSRQENYKTIKLSLELDIFTTYKLGSDFEINNAFIERKHCNRWVLGKNTSTIKTLDAITGIDSIQNNTDDIEVDYPKYLAKVTHVRKNPNSPIVGWLVMVVSPIESFCGNYERHVNDYTAYYCNDSGVMMPYSVLVAPILYGANGFNTKLICNKLCSERSYLPFQTVTEVEWDAKALMRAFKTGLKKEEYSAFCSQFKVYSIQISKNDPFDEYMDLDSYLTRNEDFDYIFDSESFLIHNSNVIALTATGTKIDGNLALPILINSGSLNTSFKRIQVQVKDMYYWNYDPFHFDIFNLNLRNVRADLKYEPRLLKSCYTRFSLNNLMGTRYDFDLFNINYYYWTPVKEGKNGFIEIQEKEFIQPEGIQCFDTVNNNWYDAIGEGGKFSYYNIYELKGSIYILDYGIPVVTDAYTDYIMSNRNYKLTSFMLPAYGDTVKNAANIGLGNYGKAVSGIVDQTSKLLTNFAAVDDLKNTPDSMKNVKATSLLNMNLGPNAICDRIEHWEVKEEIKKQAYDYYKIYGYKYNKIENSSNWFGRYIYNYVKTGESVVNKIVITSDQYMSLEIKNRISQALLNGVTFWEKDSGKIFNYDYENWEKSIIG